MTSNDGSLRIIFTETNQKRAINPPPFLVSSRSGLIPSSPGYRVSGPLPVRFMQMSVCQLLPSAVLAGRCIAWKVNLKAEKWETRQVLRTIEQHTFVGFAYRPKSLPEEQKISLSVGNEPWADVLDMVVRPWACATKPQAGIRGSAGPVSQNVSNRIHGYQWRAC